VAITNFRQRDWRAMPQIRISRDDCSTAHELPQRSQIPPYSAGGQQIWSGPARSPAHQTVLAGQAINYVISQLQAGVTFAVGLRRVSKPSKITCRPRR